MTEHFAVIRLSDLSLNFPISYSFSSGANILMYLMCVIDVFAEVLLRPDTCVRFLLNQPISSVVTIA